MELHELIGQYYGMDWIAMTTTLIFIYLIGDKKKYGFIFGVVGCLAWIFVNYLANIWPGIILNVILVGLNTRGYLKWKKAK